MGWLLIAAHHAREPRKKGNASSRFSREAVMVRPLRLTSKPIADDNAEKVSSDSLVFVFVESERFLGAAL